MSETRSMGYFWVVHEVAAILGDKVVDACLHGGEDNRSVGFMLDDVLVPSNFCSGPWIAKIRPTASFRACRK